MEFNHGKAWVNFFFFPEKVWLNWLNSINDQKKAPALLSSPLVSPPENWYVVLWKSWNWARTPASHPLLTGQHLCAQSISWSDSLLTHRGDLFFYSFTAMAKWSLLFLYLFQGLIPLMFGQQQGTAGPWRHRIQWENNGQVYSLMSTGMEYQPPVRSRSQSRVYVSGRRDGTRSQMPGAHRATMLVRPGRAESRHLRADHGVEPGYTAPALAVRQDAPFNVRASGSRQQLELPYAAVAASYPGVRRYNPAHTNTINASAPGRLTDFPGRRGSVSVDATALHTGGGEPGPGAQYQQLRAVPEALSVSRQPSQTIPSYTTTLARESEAPAPFPAPSEDVLNEAADHGGDMVNDDPRNPLKTHRNSVFYNTYPSRGRSATRTRRPPGTGYGTRYFQNGKLCVLIIWKVLSLPYWHEFESSYTNMMVQWVRQFGWNLLSLHNHPLHRNVF